MFLTRFIDEYRGKKVSINKVFDSTHKESIKKAREGITPIVDSLKLWALKVFHWEVIGTAQKNHLAKGNVFLLIQDILWKY